MQQGLFNDLHALFVQNAFNAFVGTEPNANQKRETIYSDVWGLQNFLGMMKSLVQQRDAILAQRELAREQAEADEDIFED
jgi:hypothetical protein